MKGQKMTEQKRKPDMEAPQKLMRQARSPVAIVSAGALKKALLATDCVSYKNATLQTIRCLRVCISDGKLTLVATNGKVLVSKEIVCKNYCDVEISIPRPCVAKIQKCLSANGPDVTILTDLDMSSVQVDFGEISITTEVEEGHYPKWENIVTPIGSPLVEFVADRHSLICTLKRFVATNNTHVVFSFDPEENRAVVRGCAEGALDETIDVADNITCKEKISIGADPELLLDVISGIDADHVLIRIFGKMSPIKITPVYMLEHRSVVMPMRID